MTPTPAVKLPPGYTLDDDVKLPQGYTLDAPNNSDDPRFQLSGGIAADPTALDRLPEAREAHAPEGSAAGRFVGNLWKNTAGGLIDMGILAAKTTQGAMTGEDVPELTEALKAIVQGHVDEWKKAGQAWDEHSYVESLGHRLAAMLPLLGPAAAAAAEKIGGERAEFDRYGNTVARQELPDLAGGLGAGIGQVTMAAAPGALRGRRLPVRIWNGMRSQLNPVEARNQGWLETAGVDTSLSMRTGSRTARNLEGSVQNDIGGARYAQDARQATRGDVQQMAGQLLDRVEPGGPITPEQAGLSVLGKFKRDIQQLTLDAKGSYNRAWRVANDRRNYKQVPKQVRTQNGWEIVEDPATGNPVMEDMPLPVDMRPMKMALRPIIERYARTMSKTQQNASLGLATMREIVAGPDYKTLPQAELDNGLLKKAAKQERGMLELRDQSQGLAAHTLGQLQQDIDSTMAAAHGGQQGITELHAGRSATAKKWGLYETAKKFGKPNMEDLEPVSVFRKLTGEEDVRVQFLRKIRAIAPAEMPKVGRAFLEGIFDRVFREGGLSHTTEALNKWDSLGKEAKRVLFRDPALVADLDEVMVAFKRLAAEPNPSGSGYIVALNAWKGKILSGIGIAAGGATHGTEGAGLGLVAAGGLHVISNAALARLMYSPKWTALLRRGIQFQLSGDTAAAAATAAQLARMAGGNARMIQQEQNDRLDREKRQRPPLSSFDK